MQVNKRWSSICNSEVQWQKRSALELDWIGNVEQKFREECSREPGLTWKKFFEKSVWKIVIHRFSRSYTTIHKVVGSIGYEETIAGELQETVELHFSPKSKLTVLVERLREKKLRVDNETFQFGDLQFLQVFNKTGETGNLSGKYFFHGLKEDTIIHDTGLEGGEEFWYET